MGVDPVLLCRGDRTAVFTNAGFDAVVLPDRNDGFAGYESLVARYSAVVHGGGGIFEDRVDAVLSQTLAARYAARLLAAANLGVPTAVHAVGLETRRYAFASVERIIGDALRTARTVGLRDARSVDAARARFGVDARLVTDPAVITLGKLRRPERAPNGRAAFMPFARLAWPHTGNPDAGTHARQDPDWERAAEFLGRFDEVVIVPFHSSDVGFVERIAEAIARRSRSTAVTAAPFTPDDPLAAVELLADCGSALTMRYHGFVAAYFAGIREIEVIGTSQKLSVTAELNRAGALAGLWDPAKAERELHETVETVLA